MKKIFKMIRRVQKTLISNHQLIRVKIQKVIKSLSKIVMKYQSKKKIKMMISSQKLKVVHKQNRTKSLKLICTKYVNSKIKIIQNDFLEIKRDQRLSLKEN